MVATPVFGEISGLHLQNVSYKALLSSFYGVEREDQLASG